MVASPSQKPAAHGDRESQRWLAALRDDGAARDGAIARLHELLHGAARFELSRRRAALSFVRGEELDDIATQAADDALVAILGKLDDFRGESRFTTWAYKFALLEAGVRLRRRAWQDREVVLAPEAWDSFRDSRTSLHERLEAAELLDDLRAAIDAALTPHQRTVFIALALNEVPIDVLSERLGSSRGALYKALHDARKRLRTELGRGAAMGAEEHRDELDALLGPDAEEVSCERCFELIDAFVDAELAGDDAGARFPGMEAHLSGCPACREDHESLRALAAAAPP